MSDRTRSWLLNLGLVIFSIMVGYFAIELMFFRFMLPNMALNVRPHLPETADVLVQSSKLHLVPQNYIALLGDSYAEGLGDWLFTADGNEARPFHSAHVIHELTGQDVVSFGKGGAGSAEALVLRPTRIMGGSRCLIFPSIRAPTRIVIYFFEGNDINDNLSFLEKVRARYGRTDAALVDTYLEQDYGTFARWRCHLYLGDTVARMIKFAYENRPTGQHNFFPPRPAGPPGETGTNIEIAGQVFGVRSPLIGPALELHEGDIKRSVEVLERSLAWVRKYFSNVPITLVYLPSPHSVYRHVGDTAGYVYGLPHRILFDTAPTAAIGRNSNLICNLVREASLHWELGFLDARPTLRNVAARGFIHGPRDWGHFNELGYRALGEFVARNVVEDNRSGTCTD